MGTPVPGRVEVGVGPAAGGCALVHVVPERVLVFRQFRMLLQIPAGEKIGIGLVTRLPPVQQIVEQRVHAAPPHFRVAGQIPGAEKIRIRVAAFPDAPAAVVPERVQARGRQFRIRLQIEVTIKKRGVGQGRFEPAVGRPLPEGAAACHAGQERLPAPARPGGVRRLLPGDRAHALGIQWGLLHAKPHDQKKSALQR